MGIARAGEAGLGALDTRPLSAWEPAPRAPQPQMVGCAQGSSRGEWLQGPLSGTKQSRSQAGVSL